VGTTRTLSYWLFSALVTLGMLPAAAMEIDGERLYRDLDANSDGQLDEDEVGQEHRLLFKRLLRTGDEDGDGRLSADEFAAALVPVRAEKGLAEKVGSRLPGADALTVLLAKMDRNQDRRLEAEEIPERYQRLFEQMLRPGDDDKDGVLNQREIARAAPRLGIMAQMAARRLGLDVAAEFQKLPAEQVAAMDQMNAYGRPGQMLADPAQAEQLFNRLDGNGDEQLTAEEAPGPFAERFEGMLSRGDQDGDQQLSKKEFMAFSRRVAEFEAAKADPATVRRTVRQLLNRFDGDGDGKLSVREVPKRMAENFDRADGDANGLLDRTELARVAETMARAQQSMSNRSRLSAAEMESTDSPPDRPARKKKARGKPRG